MRGYADPVANREIQRLQKMVDKLRDMADVWSRRGEQKVRECGDYVLRVTRTPDQERQREDYDDA